MTRNASPLSRTAVSITTRFGHRLINSAIELGLRSAQDLHAFASLLRCPDRQRAAIEDAPLKVSRLTSILPRVERSLAEKVLPFWARHALDEESGGFITHLDCTGRRLGPTDKYLVMQARLIWTLAAAHRYGLTDQGYLELAGQGVGFIVDRMWDAEHGGFLWTVKRDGSPLDTRKIVYGQAFAIYGLAEYALAANDPQALNWAERTFDVLVQKAADGHLGFREEFVRDWTPAAGQDGIRKTLNVHLHLLEALTALVEASGREAHSIALRRIVDLLLAKAIHPRYRYPLDSFDRAWRPQTRWRHRVRINYGHGVELAWLVLRATDILGQPRERVREPVLGLIDHALAYGFDQARGGLARYGPPVGAVSHAVYLPEERLTKEWWQQAEMLVATLEAYRWTGSARYLLAFEKQFDWIWRYQTDHNGGDWFEFTTWREGRPLGLNKGHEWKDPYHNARALMEVSRGLRALGVEPQIARERSAPTA